MKRAALGIRMHSGWGVLVAVAGDGPSLEVLERKRIVVIDSSVAGSAQPYHHGASLALGKAGLAGAARHIAECAAVSERIAVAVLEEVRRELEGRQYRIGGCAVLLASGRALPALEKILGAHPLIHTAEGEFFRDAVRKACGWLKIPAMAIPEREVEERAKTVFGKATGRVVRSIASAGGLIGPPWTKDHKAAALAAAMMLQTVV
jgi:hypothetical protein